MLRYNDKLYVSEEMMKNVQILYNDVKRKYNDIFKYYGVAQISDRSRNGAIG